MNKKIISLATLIFLVGTLALVTAEKNWAFENYTVNVSHNLSQRDDLASPNVDGNVNVVGNFLMGSAQINFDANGVSEYGK